MFATKLRQRRQVFQVVEVHSRIDLNRLVIKFIENVIECFENYRQTVDPSALSKLLTVKRVDGNFELIQFYAGFSVFLKRQPVCWHRGKEALARGVFDVVGHVRIHERLAA